MCGEDDDGALRHVVEVIDGDGASCFQVGDDVRVVDDLVFDVDGRAVAPEGAFDDFDGPHNAGAEASGAAQVDVQAVAPRR